MAPNGRIPCLRGLWIIAKWLARWTDMGVARGRRMESKDRPQATAAVLGLPCGILFASPDMSERRFQGSFQSSSLHLPVCADPYIISTSSAICAGPGKYPRPIIATSRHDQAVGSWEFLTKPLVSRLSPNRFSHGLQRIQTHRGASLESVRLVDVPVVLLGDPATYFSPLWNPKLTVIESDPAPLVSRRTSSSPCRTVTRYAPIGLPMSRSPTRARFKNRRCADTYPPQTDASRAQQVELQVQARVHEELKKLQQREAEALAAAREKISAQSTDEKSTESGASRASVAGEIEQLRKKLEGRKEVRAIPDSVEAAQGAVVRCLRENDRRPLDCWQEVETFKTEVRKLEKAWVDKVVS